MTLRPEHPELDFPMPVSRMIQQGYRFHDMFLIDQAELVTVDPELTVAFAATLLAKLQLAEATPAPTEARAEQGGYTEEADEELEDAKKLVNNLRFKLGLAFESNLARKLHIYGFDEYARASRSRPDMAELMNRMLRKIALDQTELTAVGFTAASTADFLAGQAALRTADREQGKQVELADRAHDPYVTNNNGVYALMRKISAAAKEKYQDNYAKYRTYLLDPESSPGELLFTMDIPVGPSPVFHHILHGIDPTQPLTFHILEGVGTATICFASADGGVCATPNSKEVEPGAPVTYTYAEFGAVGQHLRITQDGANNMKVRVKLEE